MQKLLKNYTRQAKRKGVHLLEELQLEFDTLSKRHIIKVRFCWNRDDWKPWATASFAPRDISVESIESLLKAMGWKPRES